MNLSPSLESFLIESQVPFDILEHAASSSSMETAHLARITPSQLAKAVVVKNEGEYMMCLMPASHRLVLEWVDHDYEGSFQLVPEAELAELFPDCKLGAVPALGQAYDMRVVWDTCLRHADDIYIEAGDHRHLIHLTHEKFLELMEQADHATISCTPEIIGYYEKVH